MYLEIFKYIQIIVLTLAGQETRLLHFSPHLRDKLKANVLIYHQLLPSPALSCIECSADETLRMLPHTIWNGTCIACIIAKWYDGQLSENRFYWEHVKHLNIRSGFKSDAGTAGQELLCAKFLKF